MSAESHNAADTLRLVNRDLHIELILDTVQNLAEHERHQLLSLLEDAERIATRKPPLYPYIAAIAAARASYALSIADFQQSISEAMRALDLFSAKGIKHDHWRNRALHTLAVAYHYMGNNTAALEITFEQIEACRDTGDRKSLVQALNRSAAIYTQHQDHRAAIEAYLEALEIVRQDKDPAQTAFIMGNIALNYKQVGDFQHALEFSQEAARIARPLNKPHQLARILINMADICISSGGFAEARQYLSEAENVLNGFESPLPHVILDSTYGRLHTQERQPSRAIHRWQKVLAHTEKVGNQGLSYRIQAHEGLAAAYRLLGDFERALHHYQRFAELREQARSEDNERKIRNLEVMHRTQQARQEASYYEQRTRDLEQDQQYLRRLSEMKSEMMNTATHDLKNPLAAIITTVHTLRQMIGPDPALQPRLDRIDHQVQRMTTLIGDLLDLAKIETGRAIEKKSVRLQDLIYTAQQDVESIAQDKQIDIICTCSDEDIEVFADPAKIRMALDNLLSNAINYSDANSRIYIRVEADAQGASIAIEDEGIGIPPDDLEHIFERFYRSKSPQHRNRDGTGLGLAIVRAIVEQHDSTITVSSTLGQGSIFRFSLPTVAEALI